MAQQRDLPLPDQAIQRGGYSTVRREKGGRAIRIDIQDRSRERQFGVRVSGDQPVCTFEPADCRRGIFSRQCGHASIHGGASEFDDR